MIRWKIREGKYWDRRNDMTREGKYCSKVIETKFNKHLVMTEKDHKDFNNSAKCWIVKKHIKKMR